jgi:hypothetical protein
MSWNAPNARKALAETVVSGNVSFVKIFSAITVPPICVTIAKRKRNKRPTNQNKAECGLSVKINLVH